MVQAIPEGYHSVTPYLHLRDAARAIDFYRQHFGATELVRMLMPDGRIGHAELKIGDSMIMLADEHPEAGVLGPQSLNGTSVSLALYTDDCDAMFHRAVAGGARVLRPLVDQFYGDRSGTLEDPFGHMWTISTHKEDLTPAEMKRRMAKQKAPSS